MHTCSLDTECMTTIKYLALLQSGRLENEGEQYTYSTHDQTKWHCQVFVKLQRTAHTPNLLTNNAPTARL